MIVAAVIALTLPTVLAGTEKTQDAGPFEVDRYLCESPEYAMDFASAVAGNAEEEYAKDIVGKIAKREVCGRYTGVAFIQDQKTVVSGGFMYRLTALRFREDQRVAWAAERVFAVENRSTWHL